MDKTIIAEGKTTNEAIEEGLRKLKLPKEAVEIKVLNEEDKRSFFSILAPRVVKVELTVKDKYVQRETNKINTHEFKILDENSENVKKAIENIEEFLEVWIKSLPSKEINYAINVEREYIKINITGQDINYLIGYRGDVLNSLQVILSSIANKGIEGLMRVVLDIEGYRMKREKTLEELADKLAKTACRNGKKIILEPMPAYERKIIHTRLQNNNKVKTESIGEEPYRKIVISLK